MLFDLIQIFLAGMWQRAEQSHEVTAGESFGLHRDDLADRHATSFYDESLVAISHAVHDF